MHRSERSSEDVYAAEGLTNNWSRNTPQETHHRHHESETRVMERRTEGESSEKDRERGSTVWTRTATEGAQETSQRYRHQRGKPDGPPSIGVASPTP